ncbi:hypothetical protein DBIPINDM_003644 [Mesorhizobium sp. AR02]|uniref:hypothetical protein n=1 Tax=Mesorhizobium sp. AR02 TaxID=2865837 RepID=UPI0021608013|nr:hypothetical protein [Mesorhizobium sp. AR02]UVK50478.1 hypothetical protein DBIPINDM_003644 [Mesorhizobium sp. AR02]
MAEDNDFYVGVDVSKAKHAIAIAEGGREGEVRYFGEFEVTPAAWNASCVSWSANIRACISATRPVQPATGL